MQAGEYAYHAEPYGQPGRAARAKADVGSAGKVPFRAACGSSSRNLFGKIQVINPDTFSLVPSMLAAEPHSAIECTAVLQLKCRGTCR